MRDSHHDHLINLRDGKVIEFTNEEIEKLQAEIARKLGFKLVDHRLELYCVPLDDYKILTHTTVIPNDAIAELIPFPESDFDANIRIDGRCSRYRPGRNGHSTTGFSAL